MQISNRLAMKNKGFTLIEFMLGLVIISIMTISIYKIIKEIDNVVITNSIKEEVQYISTGISKYILDNYDQLKRDHKTTVKLSELTNYLQKDFEKFNSLGLIPCIYLNYVDLVVYPFLYYIKINNSFEKKLSYLDFEKIISKIGASAGFYYKSSDINKIQFKSVNNGWTPDFDIANLDVNVCNDTPNVSSLPDKGILINLALDNSFTTMHTKNSTMETPKDDKTSPGKSENKNTYITNVSLHNKGSGKYPESFHELYLDVNKGIGLIAEQNESDTLSLNNSNFNADDFILLTNSNAYEKDSPTISQGALCESKHLGRLAGQLNSSGTGKVVASQLQCSYSPVLCDGGDYCYLPVNENKIAFHPYWISFECPKGYFIIGEPKLDECYFDGRGIPLLKYYYKKNDVFNLKLAYKVDGFCAKNVRPPVYKYLNLIEVICSNSNYMLSYTLD